MIRVAIVEDDLQIQNQFSDYIQKYGVEHHEVFETHCFNNGYLFIENFKSDYDIVLMDIEMPLMNGIEAARKMREKDSSVTLVFITNMAQYAINGYEVDARDFILKPLNYSRFEIKFQKALLNSKKNKDEEIQIKTTDGIMMIKISELVYVESNKHYIIFHTLRGNYTARMSIADLEKELENKPFSRCNTSFLVNLSFVKKITKNIAFVGNEELVITRGKKDSFMADLNLYLSEGGK